MRKQKQKILVVDDQQINRLLLCKILESRYEVLQAENGLEALKVLEKEKDSVQVILLDLIMPIMDGYTFLEKVKKNSVLRNIPIIVATQAEGKESELKALEMGATDYITKPYHPTIILQRVINTIALRENSILKNTSERDFLTKLYNKETFFQKVSALIHDDADTTFSLVYFDIERFKVVNDFFGEPKGDELLKYLADVVRSFSNAPDFIGARFNADCYCVCMPHDKVNELRFANFVISHLEQFPISLKLNINFGVFIIRDIDMNVSIMCDRASLALKNIVGKYDTYIEYYNDVLHKAIVEEQEISNEMHRALAEKQFLVYIQPKFDLNNFSVIGAEALVRWNHPEKGIIPPIKFIPIFEKNGFITELDMYVFEEVCIKQRELLDKGVPVVPISVNLSRADIYKPNLCDYIVDMMAHYGLDHHLIEFEITETSYTQDSEQLIEIVTKLRELGFAISMDDFGTGYSSLNMLSEVPVDLLKIDMRFLKNLNESDAKSTSIIHFIVYMAKWLNLPVIAEGVETLEHVEYLRSVGCFNGQGYFFAKPFPLSEYEERVSNSTFSVPVKSQNYDQLIPVDDLWNSSSSFSHLFNSLACPLTLMELKGDNLEMIRANQSFYNEIMPNSQALALTSCHALDVLMPEDRSRVLETLQKLDENNNWAEFVLRVVSPETGALYWHNARFSYIQKTYNSKIFIMHVDNVTEFKNRELVCDLQEERINAVLEFAKSIVLDVNITDKKIRMGSGVAETLGMSKTVVSYPEDIIDDFVFPFEQKEEFRSLTENVFAGREQEKPVLLSFICKDAFRMWYELKYKLIYAHNEPKLAVMFLENVTHTVIRREIYESELAYRDSLIAKGGNYIEIDLLDKSVLRSSEKFLGNIGYAKPRCVDEFFSLVGNTLIHPDDKDKFLQFMNLYSFNNLLATGNKKFSFECRYLNAGEFKWVCINLSSIQKPLEKQPGEQKRSTFCYVEELGREFPLMKADNCHYKRDGRTGCYSEPLFREMVEYCLEEHAEQKNALLYVQLSQKYSASNCPKNTLNYSVVAMSNILRQSFRCNDVIAKIDDLTFAVFLQNVPGEELVSQRAKEVCCLMNEYNEKNFSSKIIGNIGCSVLTGQNTYQMAMEKVKTACQIAGKQGYNTSYMLS